MIKLISKKDHSVNFVVPAKERGLFECRYVRRNDDYFVTYLSTQSACAQGCTMCHLTTTGQTIPEDATSSDLLDQARLVLDHHVTTKHPAVHVNFNFMARGEPLVNRSFDGRTLQQLGELAISKKFKPGFLVSTIMPLGMKKLPSLVDRFSLVQPEICWSLYSIDEKFRKKWLPAAMPVNDALERLLEWQAFSNKLVKIHYALIRGENDGFKDVDNIAQVLKCSGLRVNVNLVHYNPPNDQSAAAYLKSYESAASQFKDVMPEATVKIIPPVGHDVYASCGMFIEREAYVPS